MASMPTKNPMDGKFMSAFGALCACAAVALGFYGAASSRGGEVIVHSDYAGDRRSPAAIRRVFDFSHLDGSALKLASQKRLVSDARVILAQKEVGVELGHFVTKSEDGKRLFACEYFDRLSLTFEAEGIAEGGEKATMRIEAPCLMSQDLNRIAPIWIPTTRLAGEKPGDMELAYDEAAGVRFRFENMPSQWPKSWVMTNVTIFNSEESGHRIAIDREEMALIADHPIRVSW